ncbi:acid phosphatase type 7-like [Gigantopelta aegis]|uniref:acid phosphatase type 7-like n=1 Tax=Gigantopelta aegis TaxID=1735272 RepID=UPI001B8889CE|nr:acid phosphatase type 7-like [Gigantopelta aegis]
MGLQTKSLDFLVYEAVNHEYEAVFHVGDITEGLGLQQGKIGDKYLKRIQKMTVSIPYLTCPGDHERFDDFIHYRNRFSMPHTPWPMPKNRLWYSIDIGGAHFVTINTEAFVTAKELMLDQLIWLDNDLTVANSKRMEHPWVIVFGHRPLYSSCHGGDYMCSRSMLAVRRHLDDILFKHGVDVYIGGHDHHYERTFPVYNSL